MNVYTRTELAEYRPSTLRLLFMTSMAMLFFAANSLLCRMALATEEGMVNIDAASFTAIRLASGAATLAVIMLFVQRGLGTARFRPISVLALFIYAICFSYSYIYIDAGTGALILFGSVQLTMVAYGLKHGEQAGGRAWAGILLAFAGLVYLFLPGVSAPPVINAMLMVFAGLAWGVYSLAGKIEKNPLVSNSWNFIGTLPLVLVILLLFHEQVHLTRKGVVLAVLSGAFASSIGYIIWYSALPYLSATRAATVQLTVPVIAATGGILLLSETVTLRLFLASIAVLGGVYITMQNRKSFN